jgi:hypothetical protein
MAGPDANPVQPCYAERMAKSKPKPEAEELPDAWERFEKAFDTVMSAKPTPMPAKKGRAPSPTRRGKRGGTKPA